MIKSPIYLILSQLSVIILKCLLSSCHIHNVLENIPSNLSTNSRQHDGTYFRASEYYHLPKTGLTFQHSSNISIIHNRKDELIVSTTGKEAKKLYPISNNSDKTNLYSARVHKRSVHNLYEGPYFNEPFQTLGIESNRILDYYNSTGAVLKCKARGNPWPLIEWLEGNESDFLGGGNTATDIINKRHLREDGSLVLLPFNVDQYRDSVHSTFYWCRASNKAGSILGLPINLRAVIKQSISVRTSDEVVMVGNAALLTCNVAPSLSRVTSVLKWQRNDGLIIDNQSTMSTFQEGHIRLLDNGNLFFEQVTSHEARWKYRCTVRDELSGETGSSNWAKLVITESKIKSSPRIITPHKEYTVKSGQDVQIACIAQVNPLPSYFWYHELLSDSETSLTHRVSHKSQPKNLVSFRPLLQLSDIKPNQAGTYVCLANNSLGEDRRRFKLQVVEAFWVKIKPEGIVMVREGSSLILDCLLNGEDNWNLEKINFTWLKNSLPISFGSKVKLMKTNRLKVASIGPQDKGMYQCIVSRSISSSVDRIYAMDSVQLSIREEAPTFKEKFYSQTLHPGSSISLKCSATGSPVPSIRWYYYGKLINHANYLNNKRISSYDDSDASILSFLNVTSMNVDDGGIYTCEAVNDVASVWHSATVSVFGSPMVHPMSNVTIATTGSTDIHCPYGGYPIERVLWSKVDGRNLLAIRGLKTHPNGTLSIVDAHIEHKGWYKCEVRGKDGQVGSGSIYVDILEKPSINPFIFGSDLREGMRATVVCSIGSGEPPFRITWYKEDVAMDQTNLDVQIESLGDYTSSLKILNIRRKHSGNYTCKVSSAQASNIYSTYTAQLVVQAAPKWILKPLDRYSALRGSKIAMDCQAEGIPPPVYQWKKVTRRSDSPSTSELLGIVSGPHMHVLENGSLVIVEVAKQDEGDYVCEVNNNRGPPLTSISRLQINDPVHFVKNFDIVKVKSGLKVELGCGPCGDQPIDIVWYKDPEMDSSFLTMPKYNLQQDIKGNCVHSRVMFIAKSVEDSSFFICSASNPYGSGEKSIQLIVLGIPQPPRSLKTVDIGSREISLTWDVPNDGNSPLLDYLLQYTHHNASWSYDFESLTIPAKDNSVVVSGLTPITRYKFRILAQNGLGYSESSEELMATTLEEAPTGIASHLSVQPLSAHSLKVSWRSPGLTSIPQRIDGYYIGFREITDYRISSSSSSNMFTYKKIETGLRMHQSSLSEMHAEIGDLKRNTRYGVVVKAYNRQGTGPTSKEIFGQTLEYDPPSTVIPRVVDVETTSLRLMWQVNDLNPIEGFIVNYKTDTDSEWIDQTANGSPSGFTLTGLRCGTRYHINVTAFNKAGRGEPSEPLIVSTTGTPPSAPSLESLVTANLSSATIQLRSWIENGCPILSFVVQYKLHHHMNWIMLSNNIIPEQGHVLVSDLMPASWYDLAMTAHSEAGSTEAQYQFATLTLDGGTIPPPSAVSDNTWQSIINDPLVVIPVFSVLLITLIITFIVLYASYKGCSSEPVITSQRSIMSQDAYFSGDKCENLNMSSFSTKLSTNADGYESHYGSCRMEPKYMLTSSLNCVEASRLICSDPDRVCSDHLYDMPIRPDAQSSIAGEVSIGTRKQLILL